MKSWIIFVSAALTLSIGEANETQTGTKALKADIESAMAIHNKARKDVRSPALKWSKKLAEDAQQYANLLAKKGSGLVHAKTRGQGENLFMGSRMKNPATSASKAWYNEIEHYKHSKVSPSNFNRAKPTGHYTQMVWKSTREVGIGMAVSEKGWVYVVARYSPGGNMIGKYPY